MSGSTTNAMCVVAFNVGIIAFSFRLQGGVPFSGVSAACACQKMYIWGSAIAGKCIGHIIYDRNARLGQCK